MRRTTQLLLIDEVSSETIFFVIDVWTENYVLYHARDFF